MDIYIYIYMGEIDESYGSEHILKYLWRCLMWKMDVRAGSGDRFNCLVQREIRYKIMGNDGMVFGCTKARSVTIWSRETREE